MFGDFKPYRIPRGITSHAVNQENLTGEKGIACMGRGNGSGRKGGASIQSVQPGQLCTLADIKGPGMVRHFWLTVTDRGVRHMRGQVLRIYYDDSPYPSVECPVGDFFGAVHGRVTAFMTPMFGMPEGRSFHCYWPMPFAKRCLITYENDTDDMLEHIFYQVDYTLGDTIDERTGYFHAHFRRDNPCPVDKDFQLLNISGGPGMFVGANIGVRPLGPSWWGEGEMKIYIDGDKEWPTIAGTGTEDYLCSGWGMDVHHALYTGCNYIAPGSDENFPHNLVSFYRLHMWDPIIFENDLRVELQQIGGPPSWDRQPTQEELDALHWRGPHIHTKDYVSNWLYDRSDDYCSVAFWYQVPTGRALPPIPDRAGRLVGIDKPFPGEAHTAF